MWRSIAGYQDYYRINEDGIVQSKYYGKWKNINIGCNGERACVRLIDSEGKEKTVSVARLVFETFARKLKPGEIVFHKDRDKWNCRLWNLEPMRAGDISKIVRGGRRAIQKVDKDGNIVCIYGSIKEASKKEFVGCRAIYNRCKNRLKNPFDLTGYTYQYDELRGGERRMRIVKCQ